VETEGSLPFSQEPSIGFYPEPEESNSQLANLFLLRYILIYEQW